MRRVPEVAAGVSVVVVILGWLMMAGFEHSDLALKAAADVAAADRARQTRDIGANADNINAIRDQIGRLRCK
jgi:hypothetical protein